MRITVRDFLENFEGKSYIYIDDESNPNNGKRFRKKEKAIEEFGYFSVKSWSCDSSLIINIRSEF